MPKVVGTQNGSMTGGDNVQTRRGIAFIQKEFSITYLVLSDTLDDTEDDILDTSGIPPLFYPYNGALCRSRNAHEETRIVHPVTGVAASLWAVECRFDSNGVDEEDESNAGTPESQRPRVSWAGENENENLAFDAETGDAIVNACGEPIFCERPGVYPILSIKRYEVFPFDPLVMTDYSNTVNLATFWGAPEGSALMMPMEVSEDTVIGNRRYVEVSYRIKFNILWGDSGLLSNTWKLRVPHQGCKYRPAAGAAPVVARVNGQPTIVNLNSDGTRVADGGTVRFLEINRFVKSDFNNLSLGPF